MNIQPISFGSYRVFSLSNENSDYMNKKIKTILKSGYDKFEVQKPSSKSQNIQEVDYEKFKQFGQTLDAKYRKSMKKSDVILTQVMNTTTGNLETILTGKNYSAELLQQQYLRAQGYMIETLSNY